MRRFRRCDPKRARLIEALKKPAVAIILAGLFLLNGCAALAPNSWNVTFYQDPRHMANEQIGLGLSGPLPTPRNK
jgi:hypothetical protein